jgi:hypothetical protein
VYEKEKDMRVILDEMERTGMSRNKGRLCCQLVQGKWCFEGKSFLKDAYTHVN